ncbi:peptidase M16 [Pilimelia terevasa]|uniref:Peptidase M16 n=1 Tax=Pilimelia terevasa TaxID=53372 RepID=A0A8J3FJN1_9ACTN|nr:pitrilysin family protein [Pilimelia terevasa]GGK38687.1 peptidase M16 [Pilimelia terevasa]
MTAPLLADRPPAGPPRPYAFPPLVRLPVAGGEVLAAHLPGQPLAEAVLLLDAGAGRERPGAEGAAGVLLKALEEGTATRDATAYAYAMECLGAQLSTHVDWDRVEVGVSAHVDRLLAAVGLLTEAARTPRLDPADVTRVRDDEAAALRMEWAGPGPRADAALRHALFGDQRPGRPIHGDPRSAAALPVAEVRAYHERWFRQPGVLLVVGDLDRLDLEALGAVAFAGTGAPVPAETGLIGAELASTRRILLIDRPDAVQSTLRLGHLGPHRAHPDHVAVQLAGTVLGGSFTSRLNHLLREVRGFTYGVRGEFAASRRFGRFTVRAAVRADATAAALTDAVGEVVRIRAEGVTEDEVAVARSWRAGQLSVESQTTGAIARLLSSIVVHGLPDDFVVRQRERYLAATPGEVAPAAATHLRPDDLVLVVEGDAARIRADLAGTGLGEIVDVPRLT